MTGRRDCATVVYRCAGIYHRLCVESSIDRKGGLKDRRNEKAGGDSSTRSSSTRYQHQQQHPDIMTTTTSSSNRHRRGPATALLLPLLLLLLAAALGGLRGAGAVSLPVEGALTVTTTKSLPPQPQPQRRPAVAPAPPSAQEASDDPSSSSYYEVLIVPHSHCDAGYKKSVEGYYLTEVKRVLDSVVAALEGDATLKFAWAEAAYLWRWWQVRVCRLCVCCILVVLVLGREEDIQPLIDDWADPLLHRQHFMQIGRRPQPAAGLSGARAVGAAGAG